MWTSESKHETQLNKLKKIGGQLVGDQKRKDFKNRKIYFPVVTVNLCNDRNEKIYPKFKYGITEG